MPQKLTKPPKFRSESEEAAWWASPEGRRYTQREFDRAARQGRLLMSAEGLTPGTLAELLRRAKQNATRPISIRLPIEDVERAKKIAASKGIGYQTVLKQAIRKGLPKTG